MEFTVNNNTVSTLQPVPEGWLNETRSVAVSGKQDLMMAIYKYGIFVIALCGTVGNVLSLQVLSRRRFSTMPTTIFLRFLAVFDTLTLWSYVVYDITHFFYGNILSDIFCKFLYWIMASAPHVASHMLLAVTVERMFAVIYPLRVRKTFTKQKALVSAIAVAVVPFCYNLLYFFVTVVATWGQGRKMCTLEAQWKAHLKDNWYYFDVCIGVILPAILVLIININTMVAYRRARNKTKILWSVRSRSSVSGSPDKGSQLTVMLLTVSLTFWVLMLPSGVAVIVNIHTTYRHSNIIRQVAYLLMLTNNAINFLLYLVTGTKFRHIMNDMVRCQ